MSGETAEQYAANTCVYCRSKGGSIHSGVAECNTCWDWRKLKLPAMRYWVKAVDGLFTQYDKDGNYSGSGPDPIDWRWWTAMGIDKDVEAALLTLKGMAFGLECQWALEQNYRMRSW